MWDINWNHWSHRNLKYKLKYTFCSYTVTSNSVIQFRYSCLNLNIDFLIRKRILRTFLWLGGDHGRFVEMFEITRYEKEICGNFACDI